VRHPCFFVAEHDGATDGTQSRIIRGAGFFHRFVVRIGQRGEGACLDAMNFRE
jgi:hypothetical protein